MSWTRRGLLYLLGGAAASVALPPRKSFFFFFDPISLPRNSLREPLAVPRGIWHGWDGDELSRFLLADEAVERRRRGQALRAEHVLVLNGMDPVVPDPRRRGSGNTTQMLAEAVACASTGRFARVMGWSMDYTRELVERGRAMALRAGVDPSLIGSSRFSSRFTEGPLRTPLGEGATLFSDHFEG